MNKTATVGLDFENCTVDGIVCPQIVDDMAVADIEINNIDDFQNKEMINIDDFYFSGNYSDTYLNDPKEVTYPPKNKFIF